MPIKGDSTQLIGDELEDFKKETEEHITWFALFEGAQPCVSKHPAP